MYLLKAVKAVSYTHLVDGSNKSGVTYLNKKIMNAQELKLIDQSVTGVFSREIDLLTI